MWTASNKLCLKLNSIGLLLCRLIERFLYFANLFYLLDCAGFILSVEFYRSGSAQRRGRHVASTTDKLYNHNANAQISGVLIFNYRLVFNFLFFLHFL